MSDRKHSDCIREIHALEVRQQRPMRALVLDPNDAAARELIAQLEDQIETLRAEMREITATADTTTTTSEKEP